ncbi:MAG: hypothetical protein KAW12_18525 [Candidatus Aminicenantes bacterium]|nr:hypothetical protein [Candidatus Aminicenantes bacterium]
MYEKLDVYLEEIDHYLVVEKGGDEILSEIRSHILEKAENEFGEINKESIEKTIASYGSPKEIAEKYLEDFQIISPLYKKYLFHYTWILFVFHYGLTIVAYFLDLKIQAFPFFYVPRMEGVFDLLSQLPMTLLFDLGVVGIFFYIVSQQKGEIKLSWPKIFKAAEKEEKAKPVKATAKVEKAEPVKVAAKEKKAPVGMPKQPKMVYLILLVVGLCAVIFVYLRYGTLFFKSLDPGEVESFFEPMTSTLLSLLVISFFSLEVVFYIIRFFKNSPWLDLIKDVFYLFILLSLINFPIKEAFTDFSIWDENIIVHSVIRIVIFGLFLDFVITLVNILRNRFHSRVSKK